MIPILYLALPTLGSYIMLSFFFLRRPHLLHTTRAPTFPIRLAAHRGGSGERLENTMEAIENSMAQRADILELDCQLTRDGVVVVSHDKNLSRQSGLNKDVDSLDFQELPLYKTELEIYFSPGHFAHGSDRHMIRLEDIFQKFPRIPAIVEIKEKNEELIHKVANLARSFDRSEITIWASEKNSIMRKCKAANPDMPMAFTILRSIWILLLYYLGLLPFVSIPEKFFLCFLPTIINRTYFPFSCGWMNQLSAAVTKWVIMRKSLIQYLQDRGVQVRTLTLPQQGAGSRYIPGSTISITLQSEVDRLGRIPPLSLSFFAYKMQRMSQAVVVQPLNLALGRQRQVEL
ncbi:lysophospholipase D GDPD3 isoform X1 [Alexandromys fortis]|uniref:lysophospholipase D GDPD3 isoform X1 n=1 Tax=Alexandromys fortis TaxID=100897 RepID=UPI0021532390|nr:lysophospholipase D GDPD3 isoform X1 [Microtus fortis]